MGFSEKLLQRWTNLIIRFYQGYIYSQGVNGDLNLAAAGKSLKSSDSVRPHRRLPTQAPLSIRTLQARILEWVPSPAPILTYHLANLCFSGFPTVKLSFSSFQALFYGRKQVTKASPPSVELNYTSLAGECLNFSVKICLFSPIYLLIQSLIFNSMSSLTLILFLGYNAVLLY